MDPVQTFQPLERYRHRLVWLTVTLGLSAFLFCIGLVVQPLKVRILVKACGADLKWWRQD